MQFSNYLFSNLDVTIADYEQNKRIKLSGYNNWRQLTQGRLFFVLISGILLFLIFHFLEEYIFFKIIGVLLTILGLNAISSIYQTVKNRRHIKESIEFNHQGIIINHQKNTPDTAIIISKDHLKPMIVIVERLNYKFFINNEGKAKFEFAIFTSREDFIQEISTILALDIREKETFNCQSLFKLLPSTSKAVNDKKSAISINTHTTNPQSDDNHHKKIDNRPTYFYIQSKNDIQIIQPRIEYLNFPKRLYISQKTRQLWHYHFFFVKEIFKFSEIKSLHYEVKENTDYRSGTKLEGHLYLTRLNNKKRKIFTITKIIKKDKVLTEFELLKDLKLIEGIILKNKN